jgi:tight adherence protein B
VTGEPHWLLYAAAALLSAGMVATAVAVLRESERQKNLTGRISQLTNAEARRPRAERRSIARAAVTNRLTPRQRIAAQFGFDPDRTAHYALRPWMILVLTLVAARSLTLLTSGVFGSLSLLATPVVWVLLCRSTFSAMDDRFSRLLVKQFPDALQMIVRSVRVGIPVSEAIRVVGKEAPQPTRGEFERMAGELAIGATLEDAIKSMAARTGLPEHSFFATTITLQASTGGSLGETLDGLADVIRRRIALRQKGMAMASQAKTSAGVLIALPFLSGGGMYMLNPAYIGLLFSDPLGHKMLGLAAASLIVGVLIMRAVIRRSLA